MNTYEREQLFTDRYGDAIMRAIAISFGCGHWQRVTDKETQVKGIDYYTWKDAIPGQRGFKLPVDLKIDYYENNNMVMEEDQQYTGIGEKSWLEHDSNIYIAYIKLATKKVWIYKTGDLKEFMKTDFYKNRKSFETNREVNGKHGHFKNFRLDELPVHHVVDIAYAYNPFIHDDLLQTKKSRPDDELYGSN